MFNGSKKKVGTYSNSHSVIYIYKRFIIRTYSIVDKLQQQGHKYVTKDNKLFGNPVLLFNAMRTVYKYDI